MTLWIRRADLLRDRRPLIDFFRQFLTPNSDDRRFDWLYLQNLHGPARVWLAEERDAGEIIGAAAAFPRRFSFRGEECMGFILGDFCLHPRYRSLGPAVQLQRACLEQVASKGDSIVLDFPSEGMLAVYKRLRLELQGRMIRLAKPLRTDRKVAEIVKSRMIARGISAVGNTMLGWRDQWPSSQLSAELALHQGPCEEEFSMLAAKIPIEGTLCTVRTAAYLNWRFLAHPSAGFEILTARRDGILVGYLIFAQDRGDGRIADLMGINDTDLLRSLIARAVQLLRERGVMTVSAAIAASHPLVHLFETMGFHRRDSCAVLFWTPIAASADSEKKPAIGCFLMDGDRDS